MGVTKTVIKRKSVKKSQGKKDTGKKSSLKRKTTKSVITKKQHITPEILHQIEEAAYYIWLNKGCPENQDLENWKEAEQQILGRQI